MSQQNTTQTAYTPDIRKSRGLSPLWILPLVTMVLAGWLVFKAIHDAGVRIQIQFENAQGLVAGRTTIRYQGLEVGMVRDIKLSEALDSIYVHADIYPEATQLLSNQTRFWMVKPTASLSGVSGLDTLVSGNYIAIQPGALHQDDYPTQYQALDSAPSDLLAQRGLTISLKANDLGGISVGSQIVYKKIPIGEVFSYQLDDDAQSVSIHISIKDEYRHIINTESRFWNVSGVETRIGFDGVDVRLENLSALIGGSIAVDSPEEGKPVEQNAQFRLYRDLNTAGRGIAISITLPDDNHISAAGAPIIYRGIEIGQITDLQLTDNRNSIVAAAAIQPAFSDMLNSGSQFILEEAQVSLTGVENLTNLVKGNYLTLIPGSGERARTFNAIRKNEFKYARANSISFNLVADNSFGLEAGTPILYRGVAVGSITDVKLKLDAVEFSVVIDEQYRELIRSQNRFYVTGSASAELTESGLSVSVPPAKQLLLGSISFASEGSDTVLDQYRLFASQSLAELAKYNQSGSRSLTLFANELPSINAGSPLLYRNLKVGSIAGFTLTKNGVQIEATIEKQYQHLLTANTVFWNRSGVEIKASLDGVDVKAAPLQTLLRGGIAFDSLPGIENKVGAMWKLYRDYDHARRYGEKITLTALGTLGVKVGTPVQYQGVQIGEVFQVIPDFDSEFVTLSARIEPQYAPKIAKQNSQFWLSQAKIGLSGIENVQNLLGQSIEVQPGSGADRYEFALHKEARHGGAGKTYILQSEKRGSVSVGTPILYRDIEVGKVIDVRLGEFADRVITTIRIAPQYTYLLRENSVFWNVSGLDMTIGITGANVKAGTFDSMLRGGITFATPDQKQLLPAAAEDHSFYLHPQAQEQWSKWRTPIPKP
ncbi:MCE family protein [Vibrio sp. HDW18]|uniref:PqiB family protein n=1 Tax=Vibrio sp. HDW18 TaxID=2714948 RepID=UPI0014076967|nr:PqiB family protein [Vibrio sp. HDW18]QIL84446.1 MCE family protein [Vibrio sp. HDW18]